MVTGHKDKKGDFHPHTGGKSGVSENDMKISVKGNNDVISVKSPSSSHAENLKKFKELTDRGVSSAKAYEMVTGMKSGENSIPNPDYEGDEKSNGKMPRWDKNYNYESLIKNGMMMHPPEEHKFGVNPTSQSEIEKIYDENEAWMEATTNHITSHEGNIWKGETFRGEKLEVKLDKSEKFVERAFDIMNRNGVRSGIRDQNPPNIGILPNAEGLEVMGGTRSNNIIGIWVSEKYDKIIVKGTYDETEAKFMKVFKMNEQEKALSYLGAVIKDIQHNTVPSEIYYGYRKSGKVRF